MLHCIEKDEFPEVKKEEVMERKRLYVDMTRAQEKLYMCSYDTASKFIGKEKYFI